MSLTNIVYTPVDTGTTNVSKEWDNANLKDFYLLTGKCALIRLPLRRSVRGFGSLLIFNLIIHLLLHLEKERCGKSLMS